MRPSTLGRARATTWWLLLSLLICSLNLGPTAAASDDTVGKLGPGLRSLVGGAAAPAGELARGAAREPALRHDDDRGESVVDVFVVGEDLDALDSSSGVALRTVLPGVATASVPISSLVALADSPLIARITAAQPMSALLDSTASHADAVDMWGGEPPNYPPSGFTGDGVIVGIVDAGIDLTHEDFKNPNGSTRIRYFWNQGSGTGVPPQPYDYGSEWSASQINAGQAYASDSYGHGTHVTGAAAGNGRATGNGYAAYRYVGLAPESDLIVVQAGSGSVILDSQVLDGVDYIFRKAGQLGMDAVVCVAYGKQKGPHDGTDPLDVAMNALAGSGRIVVAPAGNDGATNIHGEATVQSQANGVVSFVVPSHFGTIMDKVEVEGWYNVGLDVTASVRSPSGQVVGPAALGDNIYETTQDGSVWLVNTAAAGVPRLIRVTVTAESSSGLPAGEWRIELHNVGSSVATVDFWITQDLVDGAEVNLGQSTAKLITSPASASEALAVAAYSAKRQWYSEAGPGYVYPDAQVHEIAPFSSVGPRRDGLMKPDITASGYGVAAARAAFGSVPGRDIVEDGVHRMMTGTSVAAAVTTGAIATLLEQFPGLDPDSVRQILAARAKVDAFTGTVPNDRWGVGKLCLSEASPAAVAEDEAPSTEGPDEVGRPALVLSSPHPNPLATGLVRVPLTVDAQSEVRVAVYDVLGREVRTLYSGPLARGNHVLTWDGANQNGQPVASGRYYVVATNFDTRTSRALLVVK